MSSVTAEPASLRINPMHEGVNSNQDSTKTRGLTQPTQKTFLKYLGWVIRQNVLLRSTGHIVHKTTISRMGDIVDIPNKQKNKYQQAVKMGRERNMHQMKKKKYRRNHQEKNKMK